MSQLLALPTERIAAELRNAQEQAAADRAWRRATRALIWRWGVIYALGVFLGFSSMTLTGDLAQAALWGGFLLGFGAWFGFLLTMWARVA